jgi:typhasterol/6-deoxotyphasterol 2alpha-hydroxylase
MDLQGYIKRMKKLSKMFDRFLEHVVEEHNQRRMREGKSFVAKDMVDVLLQIADDPNLEVELNRESVKAFTQVSFSVDYYFQKLSYTEADL